MSSIFAINQSSLFDLPEPSEPQEETIDNSDSLKPACVNEEFIQDESTISDTCSDFNQEDDNSSCLSSKDGIHELLSESEDSTEDELAQELEKEQREQLKAVTRHITHNSIQNYFKRR